MYGGPTPHSGPLPPRYDRGNPQSDSSPLAGGTPHPPVVPLAAPRPGYPAPVANLNASSPSSLSGPSAGSLQMGQVPQALRVTRPHADTAAPRMPQPIYQTNVHKPSVPSAPHPLQPPMTPITPVFVRPSKSPAPSDVKFTETIMRGNSEDHLLPKHGGRGDDFWRRFSIVAKEEKKPSSWLAKTQTGANRLSRWVWVVGVILAICAGFGIGLWYYISHTSTSNRAPTAVGGSADETAGPSSPTAVGPASPSSLHVTPTFTLARRDMDPEPTPFMLVRVPGENAARARISRHSKKHWLHNF